MIKCSFYGDNFEAGGVDILRVGKESEVLGYDHDHGDMWTPWEVF